MIPGLHFLAFQSERITILHVHFVSVTSVSKMNDWTVADYFVQRVRRFAKEMWWKAANEMS